jgi:GntR family transcriptional regulator
VTQTATRFPIDRTSRLPLWAQLLGDLRRRLAAGEFEDRFPTDKELVATYGVSRHTAREAVRRLSAEGILQRKRGRGTTVITPEFEQPLGALYSMFRSIESQGAEQRSEVLALELIREPAVAERLQLEAGAPLVFLERVRLAGGSPLAVDRVWLAGAVAEALLHADFTHTALYDELHRRCDVVLDRATERIRPVLAQPDDCRRLAINRSQPCFAIERLGSRRDRPIEWRHTLIRGDRFAFLAEWAPGSSSSNAFRFAHD